MRRDHVAAAKTDDNGNDSAEQDDVDVYADFYWIYHDYFSGRPRNLLGS